MHNNTQMILVMDHDELPAHIRQTFKLVEENGRWVTDLSNITVAVEGDSLDMDAPGYMVVFADNTWHRMSAGNLYNQIKALRSDAQIIFIPVEVEIKEEEDEVASLISRAVRGHTLTLPTFP